jgi:hypothetical protein
MAKVVCIICGKEKKGIPVKSDRVLEAMRWFKRNVTRNEQHNTLVVCKEDWPAYNKARKKFTSRMALYVALGIVFVVFGNVLAFSINTLVATLLILVFFYLLSLLSYMPALDIKKDAKAKAGKGR